MKKLLTFLTFLTLFFGVGWAETKTATLSWAGNGSNDASQALTTSNILNANGGGYYNGDANLATCTETSRVYCASSGNGLKFGTGSYSGSMTFSITGSLKPSKITVSAKRYSSSEASLSVDVNGSNKFSSTSLTSGFADYEIAMDGNTTLNTIKIYTTNKRAYVDKITITYEEGGTTPEPTYYSLTLPTGLTGGSVTATGAEDLTAIASGTSMTVTATPNDGYVLEWLKANGTEVSNPYTFNINEDTEITASFVKEQASTTEWVLTTASALTTGDVVLIVDKYSSRAMSNDNGTSAAPDATSVTLNSDKSKVTSGVTTALQWTVTNTDGTFNFTVPGSTDHLYCINNNNGVRVGSGENNSFNITENFLYNTGQKRYLGVYSSQDWRCYTTIHDNIKNTEVAFYKKVDLGAHSVTVGTITGEGTITPSSSSANAGDQITVTATPATGYELTALAYNGTAIDISSTPYTFTMPNADVTLTATFTASNYNIYRTITAQNSSDQGGWIGNWNENCTLPDGAVGNDYVVTSTYGKEIQFKAGNNEGYKILAENVTAKDANNNNIPLTVVSNDNSGIVFKFNMPASDVTISAYFTFYQPDLYLMGNAHDQNWQTTYKMDYNSSNTGREYSIRTYFAADHGEFQFEADATRYASGAVGEYWLIGENGDYEYSTEVPLYANSSKNYRVVPGIYDIYVNKDRNKVVVTPVAVDFTFTPAAGEVYQGTTVTATSNLYTLLHAINSSITESSITNEVSLDGTSFSGNVALSNTGSATVTGRASYGYIQPTATASYTVNEIPAGSEYTLVTDASELGEGIEYVIMDKASGEGHAMSTTQNSNNRGQTELISIVNNKIIPTEDTQIITLEAATDGWYLNVGTGYLYAISSSNHLKTGTNLNSSDQYYVANITIGSENVASIEFGTPTPRYIKHNSGSSIFSCYTSGQQEVYLFKKGVSNKSAAPVITPEAGNIVGYSQEVEITQANGGTIYYTTDGTTPTETSTQYDGKFWAEVSNLGDEVTITAVAKEEGKELSNPVSVTYKFVAPVAPVFTPAGGTYTTAQEVSISSTTEGADVYYTTTAGLSAAQIVAQGTKFTTAINVSEETTYYAVTVYHDAHANRDALSSVRQAQYKFSEVESVGLPYTRSFTDNSWGEFTREEGNSNITVWTLDGEYGAKGTSYVDGYNYAATSWLLSPYINLSNANEPVLTFDHQINKHFANPSTQATVWIKTYGGEWTQLTTKLPSSSSGISGWPKYNEEYDLSAYNGQIVQIGFKYSNPTEGDNAGTWEIQNFKLVDMNQPIIEVNNIAEFMDNEKVPADRKAKILNPVVVLYHYQQYRNDNEGDYVNDYIWVKDESGYAIIYGKYLDVNYTNGDIIPGGFTATKFYYNVGRFYQMYYPEGLQPATEKALADPEAVTLSILNSNKENYNGHYVTIPKMRIKFSSGELVPYEYNFTTEESYGGQRNFEIGDATLSISSNNKSIIGYNNFDNPWLETLGYPEYENTTSDYGDYNITGIFERYNGVWEFMPIIITPWEENKVTLHDLCQDGVVNEEYTISNPLQVVYVDTDRHSVWVKDDNGQSIWSTSPAATDKNFAIDYVDNTRDNQAYYDQSNWCQLVFDGEIPSSLSRNPIINGGMIKGTFTNKLNPTLSNVVLGDEPIMQESSSYATNYYVARNFAANSDGYFFMNPKPQEYADIVWAIYDSSNNAMIMTSNPKQNPNGFVGSFKVDMSMNIKPNLELVDGTQTGKGYEHFKAIVRLASTSNAPMLKDRMPANAEYVVFPLDITQDVPTGITDVNGKAVKSVKYVNVAGVMSDVPFEGVNIVVTEYTDGSRSTSKMIKR